MRHALFAVAAVALLGTGVPGAAAQDSKAPAAVTWDAEGLVHLPKMLAQAAKSKRRLLVGLSGGGG